MLSGLTSRFAAAASRSSAAAVRGISAVAAGLPAEHAHGPNCGCAHHAIPAKYASASKTGNRGVV
jgi:hypothetical protein